MAFLLNPFVHSIQTIRAFQGTMVIGGDSYTSEFGPVGYDDYGEPIYQYQNYNASGFSSISDNFSTFGSLTPASYGQTTIDRLYFESSYGDYSPSQGIVLSRTGPDSTPCYPTINDYPLSSSPVTTTVSTIGQALDVGYYVMYNKYTAGSSVTLRFALRCDILATPGSSTVVVPTGATRAIIVAIGGGGGGSRVATGVTRRGGGGGATSISDVTVSSSAWGTNVNYTVGNFGLGRTASAGSGTAGTASTFTGLGLTMSAGGGAGGTTTAVGAGGTATGGNLVNDAGSNGVTIIDWTPPRDVAYGNAGAGGFGGVASNGVNGIAGAITIVWY